MAEVYSVYQFFEDNSYECVRRHVPDTEAAKAASFYTGNVAAKIGITKRVIITDSGDLICWEWVFGRGIIFPTAEDMKAEKKENNG